MAVRTISFRSASEKIEALDAIAESQQRDRSFLLNEAIDNYLAQQEEFRAQVREGIRQADAGQLISHAEMRRLAKTWTKRK
jgi:predicted transcriptional regulator